MGRDDLLHHHPDLLPQRRAPHRARVQRRGHRLHRPVPPAPRRGGLPPHRHGRARAEAPARRRGAGHDGPGVGRRDGAALARGLGPAGHRLRRLHPDHRGPPHARPSSSSSTPSTTTARTTSTWGPTRASTASSCEAYYTEDELVDGLVPDPRAAGRADGRGELLLPPLRLRGPAARALRGATPRRSSPRPGGTRSCRRSAAGSRTSRSAARRSTGASRCPGTRSTSATSGSTR